MSGRFVEGQKVLLQSGGPVMTVADVTERSVMCCWFSGDDLRREAFSPALLRAYEEYAGSLAISRGRIGVESRYDELSGY